jgi:hypothetical protein
MGRSEVEVLRDLVYRAYKHYDYCEDREGDDFQEWISDAHDPYMAEWEQRHGPRDPRPEPPELRVTTFDGDKISWSDVMEEARALPRNYDGTDCVKFQHALHEVRLFRDNLGKVDKRFATSFVIRWERFHGHGMKSGFDDPDLFMDNRRRSDDPNDFLTLLRELDQEYNAATISVEGDDGEHYDIPLAVARKLIHMERHAHAMIAISERGEYP